MAFIEVNILDKVISAFEKRGCELDGCKMTANTINGNFDMTYLKYHCFNITIYSSSGEADQWVCYIGIENTVSGEGSGMDWRTEYDDKYEEIVDKLMLEMKRMEQENKINAIKKDFNDQRRIF